MRRPLREGVGRNPFNQYIFPEDFRRPLREGVGRNLLDDVGMSGRPLVALYARAWVEIFIRRAAPASALGVALHVEGVGRNIAWAALLQPDPVTLHAEGVDRNLLDALTSWLKEVALRAESGDRNVDRPEGASQFQSIARGGRNIRSSSCYFYTCSAPDAQNPRFFCGSCT